MPINVPHSKVTRANVYREAGDARYAEAECLLSKHPSGAIYLAGYLIECYLKWALCERNNVQYLQNLPNSQLADMLTSGRGHNLETLCTETGYDTHFAASRPLRLAFREVAKWSPNIRYIKSCGERPEATKFLNAARTLRDDIRAWANN